MSAFVGRTNELRALAEVIEGPRRPSAALVSGVPGCGKSRLLMEARRRAPGLASFAVVGFESERRVPLAATAEFLRALTAVPRHGATLDALVFSPVAEGRGGEAYASAGALEPLQIFEAARRALRSVEPALLVIDDLQWIDDLSLSLCHYLVRAAAESNQELAILAATRPGGPGDDLFDTLPQADVHRIQIGGLDREAGTALAHALDPALDAEAAGMLWQQAQGSPFWLEALALHGQTEGGLQQILTRRLRGAGRDAAMLLGILALAGRPVSVATAADLIERERPVVEAALELLVDRGLARVQDDAARPAHDLIRATAAAQLPVELRVRIHRQLAARIERDADGDLQLLRLALEHRRAGGVPVLPLASMLARLPQRRLLGTDGAQELGALADEADALAPETVALQADVATLAYELGQHEQAIARWSLVCERADAPAVRASAALKASRAAYALGRSDEAREYLSRSRQLLAADPILALEQLTHEAAILLWLEHRAADGRAMAHEATSVAMRLVRGRSHDGPDAEEVQRALVDGLRLEYEAAMQEGDPAVLLDAAERREAAARGGILEEVLEAGLALGVALRQNGRVREALARFQRVWVESQRGVLPRLTVDAGFWLARTLALTGELGAAEAVVRDTTELVRRVGDVPRARHRVARVAANLWLERGQVADALALLEQEVTHDANEHQRIVLHGDRAVWAARLHGPSVAQKVSAEIDAGSECAARVGCPRCAGELLVISAEALSRAGKRGVARAALDQRRDLGFPLDDLDRLLHGHAAALAVETASERLRALEEILAAAKSSPYRLIQLWVALDLGRAMVAAGDKRARVELEQVATAAKARGAETVRDLAGQSLRTLGVRTWRRGAAGASLTSREREVADMVAGGSTNREVASALFLSPKTVERHLANVFRKLDVRNRTELASRLGQVGAKRT